MFFILFFLGALFRALEGHPVVFPRLSDDSHNNFFPREASSGNTFAGLALCVNNRTTWGVIRGCLFTIFACTWTAIHPNIGAPTDSKWIIFRRRLSVMACALIAPEVMVLWAMKQRQGAKRIMEKYNQEIAHVETPQNSIWASVGEIFESPPTESKGGLLPWTKTHGFYLQMGGLLLYKDGLPVQVLDYTRLKDLIDEGRIDTPVLSKADIEDRSKGDIIVKGLVVIQTLGFVVQSIARLMEGLPLIELEVITLAFAMLNGITYFLWWDKPQNVGVAVRIPLKEERGERNAVDAGVRKDSQDENSRETEAASMDKRDTTISTETQFSRHSSFYRSFYTSFASPESEETLVGDMLPRQGLSQKTFQSSPTASRWNLLNFCKPVEDPKPMSFWKRKISKDFCQTEIIDWKGWIWFIFLRVPYRTGQLICYPFSKMGGGAVLEDGRHRIPMFYAESDVSDSVLALSTVIATAFGLIHFLAWSTPFPSFPEKVLWRVTTLTITIEPAFFMMANPSWEPAIFKRLPWVDSFVTGLARLGMPLYILARLVLLVLAFSSLRDLPEKAYETIKWTGVIPHL